MVYVLLSTHQFYGQNKNQQQVKPLIFQFDLVSSYACLQNKNPFVLSDKHDFFALSEDGKNCYFAIKKLKQVINLNLSSFLVNFATLKAEPLFLGVFKNTAGPFVLENNKLGQITLLDPTLENIKTITGFELNFEEE